MFCKDEATLIIVRERLFWGTEIITNNETFLSRRNSSPLLSTIEKRISESFIFKVNYSMITVRTVPSLYVKETSFQFVSFHLPLDLKAGFRDLISNISTFFSNCCPFVNPGFIFVSLYTMRFARFSDICHNK